jgi:hypothetical protein
MIQERHCWRRWNGQRNMLQCLHNVHFDYDPGIYYRSNRLHLTNWELGYYCMATQAVVKRYWHLQ